MELVYIGFFSRIFEWVLSSIFDPVYRFVSGLLTTVFSWLFNTILAPVLMPILKDVLQFVYELWMRIYCTEFYILLSGVLKIIDYMEKAFDVFIGLSDVTYKTGETNVTGSLVDVLLQQGTVSTVFWMITLGGLGLALMLTIYATAKSAFDLDFENKRPVSKVLAAMMKTFVQFFTVPFLVYFLVKLSAVIIRGITSAMTVGGTSTLGRIVFSIATLDAARDANYNLTTLADKSITLGTSPKDIIRYPFYTLGGEGVEVTPLDYGNLSDVNKYFDLAHIDYLIGFIAAVFLLFTIGVCLITFVQRIFEIVLLYLVSPYFVCTIPLDDGEKFGKWKEMFVAKCFTGFGSAIGMRLFLMICPMMMGGQIKFGSSSSPEMDYMIKLFFLVGGAWAVYKSGPMITTLLNFQAGQSESATAAMAGGFLFSQTAGRAIAKGKGALKSGAGKLGQSMGKGGKGGKGGKDGAFTGSKSDRKGAAGKQKAMGGLKGKPGVKGAKPGIGGKPGVKGAKPGAKGRKPVSKGSLALGGMSAANDSSWKNGLSAGRKGATERRGVNAGAHLGAYRQKADGTGRSLIPEQKLDVKQHHNVSLGKLFSNTYDESGNRKFRIMGMGFTEDYKGKTTSYSFPGLDLRKSAMTGKTSVSHARLPGIMDISTNIEGGNLKYTDVALPGFRYSSNSEGTSFSTKNFSVGLDQEGGLENFRYKKHSVSAGEDGTSYSYGNHFNLTAGNDDRLKGVRIGSLNYERSGRIARETGKGQEGKA